MEVFPTVTEIAATEILVFIPTDVVTSAETSGLLFALYGPNLDRWSEAKSVSRKDKG
jgi:hypothetical protein